MASADSSKFLGYDLLAPPDTAVSASKGLGYAPLAPPQDAVSVAKVLGYAITTSAPAGVEWWTALSNPKFTRRSQPIWQAQTFPFGPPAAAPTVTPTTPVYSDFQSPHPLRRHPGWQVQPFPFPNQVVPPTVTPSNLWFQPLSIPPIRTKTNISPAMLRFPFGVPAAAPAATVKPYLFFVG